MNSERWRAGAGRDDAPSRSDGELLVAVARGDRGAFALLYDRYAARVFGLARAVLRDPAQAEEGAQEVLLEVWRTARRYDPARGAAHTWISTMTHRRAVDRVRSEQAARDRQLRVAQAVAPPYDDVSEAVEIRFEQEQVRRALDQLTDLQREAITLAYYGGNTYREVAEMLGAPLATVKTRLRDGLIRLRDALGVAT